MYLECSRLHPWFEGGYLFVTQGGLCVVGVWYFRYLSDCLYVLFKDVNRGGVSNVYSICHANCGNVYQGVRLYQMNGIMTKR